MKELMDLRFWLNDLRESWNQNIFSEKINFLGRTYYAVQFNVSGSFTVSGFGFHENSQIATTKAMVEAVERLLVRSLKLPSTNGVAAHFDVHEASQKARAELIERDAYLRYWYNGWTPLFKEERNTEFGKFSIYHLRSGKKDVEVSMAINEYKDGHVISLGSGNNWESASLKASEELVTILMGIAASPRLPIALEDFKQVKKVTPLDHIYWGLSSEAGRYTKAWISSQKLPAMREAAEPRIQELHWPLDTAKPPIHFMKAQGDEYLELFFGMPDESLEMQKKLSQTDGPHKKIPHTFG